MLGVKEPLLEVLHKHLSVTAALVNNTEHSFAMSTFTDKDTAGVSTPVLELVQTVTAPTFSVFLVFAVTLVLFPSIKSTIHRSDTCADPTASLPTRLQKSLFVPLLFLMFNALDFLGWIARGRLTLEWWKG